MKEFSQKAEQIMIERFGKRYDYCIGDSGKWNALCAVRKCLL